MAIKKVIREDKSGVDFVENDSVLLSVDVKDLSKEIIMNLALHGLSQKVGDSYAGVKSTDEAMEKAGAVVERLRKGDWQAARAAASPKSTQLAEALASATGRTLEEAVTVIAGLDDDKKKALRANPKVKAALEEIKAKNAAAKAKKLAAEAEKDDGSIAELFG